MGFVLPQVISTTIKTFKIGQYYESLGYNVPKRQYNNSEKKEYNRDYGYDKKITIKVDVRDLWNQSSKEIEYECDECMKLIIMPKYRYDNYNRDGKYYCVDCAKKLFDSGENSSRWKPELNNDERIRKRSYAEVSTFSKNVMMRDDYICQCCNKKINGDGCAHHLDSWDWCKEKRFDETNGITLCKTCHKNFHMQYGYGNNTKQQFETWIGKTLELLKYEEKLPSCMQFVCLEDRKTYTASEIAKKENVTISSVYKCVKNNQRIKGNHYYDEDFYNKMPKDVINSILNNHKKYRLDKRVILLNDYSIYQSSYSAEKELGVPCGLICQNISGKSHCVTTKFINGLPLIFMYYTDYLYCIEKNKLDKMEEYKRNNFIICLSTGKLYNNVTDATKDVGLANNSTINRSIRLGTKSGKHPITNQPMRWMKYSTFIDLSKEDKNKILEENMESFLKDSFLLHFFK